MNLVESAVAMGETITLKIEGMHCDACVRRVTKAIETVGADAESVKIGEAVVRTDNLAEVEAAIAKAGFSLVRA